MALFMKKDAFLNSEKRPLVEDVKPLPVYNLIVKIPIVFCTTHSLVVYNFACFDDSWLDPINDKIIDKIKITTKKVKA